MKQEIPKPVVYGVIAIVALVAAFFGYRVLAGPPDFPAAKIKVGPEGAVPSYMKDKMSPEMQKMIEEQTRKYGAVQGDGTQSQPTAPPGQ